MKKFLWVIGIVVGLAVIGFALNSYLVADARQREIQQAQFAAQQRSLELQQQQMEQQRVTDQAEKEALLKALQQKPQVVQQKPSAPNIIRAPRPDLPSYPDPKFSIPDFSQTNCYETVLGFRCYNY